MITTFVIHISDLHVGKSFDKDKWEKLKSKIGEILTKFATTPHPTENGRIILAEDAQIILVVSGDLCDHPLPGLMREANNKVKELISHIKIFSKERSVIPFIIPGNHDYKLLGNVGFRNWTRIPFEVNFRENKFTRPYLSHIARYMPILSRFSGKERITLGKELYFNKSIRDIVMLGFNSNPIHDRGTLATGKVEDAQIRDAKDLIIKLKADSGKKWINMLKIAVVHHHPMPIPYTPAKMRDRLEEGGMVFYNAGTFLYELAEMGFNLILHGHKHMAGFTKAIYCGTKNGNHDLQKEQSLGILSAGSPTHKSKYDPQGNGFNTISIYDYNVAKIKQHFYGQGEEHSWSYLYPSMRERRDLIFHRQRESSDPTKALKAKLVRKTVTLTKDGYSEVKCNFEACEVIGNKSLDRYPMSFSEDRPGYVTEPPSIYETSTKAPTIQVEEKTLRKVRFAVVFGEKRDSTLGPFDMGFSYRAINGHALSYKEVVGRYEQGEEEWNNFILDFEADTLIFQVEFPIGFREEDLTNEMGKAFYFGYKGEEKEHIKETSRIKKSFKRRKRIIRIPRNPSSDVLEYVEKEQIYLELVVTLPQPEFIYRIQWNYKGDEEVVKPSQKVNIEELQRKLLTYAESFVSGKANFRQYKLIKEELDKFSKVFLEKAEEYVEKITEDIEVSLAVYDNERHELRFIVTSWGLEKELFEQGLKMGEGCAGFSFAKRRVLFYSLNLDQKGRNGINYYISPEDLKIENPKTAFKSYKVLITVPWVNYDVDNQVGKNDVELPKDNEIIKTKQSQITCGVISIGSKFESPSLLKLLENDTTRNKIANNLKGLTLLLDESILKICEQKL